MTPPAPRHPSHGGDDLAGHTVVVVAGGSTIGSAIACRAAELGATVVLAGRDVAALRSVVTRLPTVRPGAWRPAPGLAVTATANGAVSFLAAALAVELAPVRVNVLSPGVVDTPYWDSSGADRAAVMAETAARNPARRVGTPADIAHAALMTMCKPLRHRHDGARRRGWAPRVAVAVRAG